jgi:hypothetical protein
MTRLHLMVGIGATAILASCSSPRSDSLPKCPFKVGDTVVRGNVGAVVPDRGKGVSGDGDDPKAAMSIQIETSGSGVVTIQAAKNGVKASPEVCQLP